VTLAELIRDARKRDLTTEGGDRVPMELLPPLDAREIADLEKQLPGPLPEEVRALLGWCGGFAGPVELVDFTGRECDFEMEGVFPHGLPIAHDGCGNFWVVDLLPGKLDWGPIYFACHDPPVILYQGPTLHHFLVELFNMVAPPHRSAVNDVHEDRLFDIWRKNPGVLSHAECVASRDDELREFAAQLSPSFEVIDLRNADIGFGFSWGRYGPQTVVKRFTPHAVFGVERRRGLIRRLFGGAA